MTMQVTHRLRAGASSDATVSAVRSILFVAILMLAWITVKPFVNLDDPKLASLEDSSDLLNQFAYVVLAGTVVTYFLIHEPWRARPLLRPAYFAMLTWLMVTIPTSNYPGLSVRRFIFTLLAMVLAAALPLLPVNFKRFCDLIAASTVVTIIICYAGILFLPEQAIHQATDLVEPLLAGDWRGVFNHKNVAGPMMAMFIFIGLFVARTRNAVLGWLIVVSAAIFLLCTHAKAATGLLPLVLVLAWATTRIRSAGWCAVLIFGVVIGLNLLTIASTQVEAIKTFNEAVMSDPTFTGRIDIWQFAVERIRERPWLGHGFGAFWETPVTYFTPMTDGNQVSSASHAHNAFLDLGLTIGIPGIVLACIWTLILPFVDFQRCKRLAADPALTTLFVRIWLFGLYTCSFESILFDRGNPNWFTMLVAIFGLRYLSSTRLSYDVSDRGALAKS